MLDQIGTYATEPLGGNDALPRVLFVGGSRVNQIDTSNNGLFYRNLYGAWPKSSLGQIFERGDNGDRGFFGHYYRTASEDRFLGKAHFATRTNADSQSLTDTNSPSIEQPLQRAYFKRLITQSLYHSGIIDMLFPPRISQKMYNWITEFSPHFVHTAGYSLAFSWLAMKISTRFRLPLIFYPTDDWSDRDYRRANGIAGSLLISEFKRTSHRLVQLASVRCAFNTPMKAEYEKRYRKSFFVFMGADDPARFEPCRQKSVAENSPWRIVATGQFDNFRIPLLHDLDEACQILSQRGYKIEATVFPVTPLPRDDTKTFKHVLCKPCPSHDDLPKMLCAADLLFLPECFGGARARGIRLSVSSKAPLYMHCGKPILVYADKTTGIATYASSHGWAAILTERSEWKLANALAELFDDPDRMETLGQRARHIALQNHNLRHLRNAFATTLREALRDNPSKTSYHEQII